MPVNPKHLADFHKTIAKIDADAVEYDDAIDAVSTGSIAVDIVTGVAGFPRGRISEVAGLEGSGKTTLCLTACAYAQRNQLYPCYLDVECALDTYHAERVGFNFRDPDKGRLVTPRKAEDALRMVEEMVKLGADLVIVDSVPSLVTEKELEGDIGDLSPVAIRARVLSSAIPKLTNLVQESKTALVFINQYRHKISTGFTPAGSSDLQTAGGNALRYFASLRLALRQTKKSHTTRKSIDITGTERESPVASLHEVEVVKSKIAAPYRKISFIIRFDEQTQIYGIDNLATIIEIGKAQGLVTIKGAWLEYEGLRSNGDLAFYKDLMNAPAAALALKQAVVALIKTLTQRTPAP